MAINQGTDEDHILLGGKMSAKNPLYLQLIETSDMALPYYVLHNTKTDNWKKLALQEKAEELLYILGQINFVGSLSELTKISAVVGDTRASYSLKGLRDDLNARIYGTSKP